jgi:hypothetical protein
MRFFTRSKKNSLLFSLLSGFSAGNWQLITGNCLHPAVLRPLQEIAFARFAVELVAFDDYPAA